MNRNLTFLIPLLLLACSREIDFNLVNVQQELVVNALIQPGGKDSLLLNSTYITKNEKVSGAKVAVTHQGDTVGRYIEKSKGLYFYQGTRFQEGEEYGLSIRHPDYPSVSAKTTVPLVPDFFLGKHPSNGKILKEIPGADFQVLLEFDDNEKTNNYYVVSAKFTYEIRYKEFVGFDTINGVLKFEDITMSYEEQARINSKSPVIEMVYSGDTYEFVQGSIDWEDGYMVWKHELFFSNKHFNGQRVSIPLDFNVWKRKNTSHIHISLTAISEEYYQLLRSLTAYEKTSNGFFPEAFQVYGNVHNGHGVWAARTQKTKKFDISEYNLFNYE